MAWNATKISYNPLNLLQLIENTTLTQAEDQYPFATIYEQEHAFYSFRQETLSSPQWYEQCNTKVDVASSIGVTRQHKVLLDFLAQETHKGAYETLTPDQKLLVTEDAEERYL